MIDPNAGETPQRLNAMAIMNAYDGLPENVRTAIAACEQQISPFRVRYLLNQGASEAGLIGIIDSIKSREDAARFHSVTPDFATGSPQPRRQD